MGNIINNETGEFGLTVADMRAAFAARGQVAFVADDFSGELEESATYFPVEQPEYDPETHKSVQVAPVEIDGVLTQQWEIVPLTEDDLAQREAERLAREQAEREARRITVTKRQACLALLDLRGIKRSDIAAAIAGVADPVTRERAQIDWEEARDIESDSPTVLLIAAALNLSDNDLRALFDYAQAM